MPGAKQWVGLLKATFKDFSEDEATWKAAALAYYTVFALPPLLVIILQSVSLIWDPEEVRRTLTGEFQSLMGANVAGQIQTMISSAQERTEGTGVRLLLSIAALLFGATGAFAALQTALNRAWEVAPDPSKGGVKKFLMKRVLSLGMLLGIAFLLLVSLALTAFLSAVGDRLFGGLGAIVARLFDFVLTFAVVTALFAAIFKVLPDASVAWRDAWVGGVATAVLFVIGKFLIGLYIGQSNPGSAFGAAGSLAVLFIWIYYAAVILLLGAEFTQAWIRYHGRRVEPAEGAVRTVQRAEPADEDQDAAEDDGARGRGVAPLAKRAAHRGGAGNQNARRDSGMTTQRETPEDVRREMRETRSRMAGTLAEVEAHVASVADGAKEKVHPASLVRRHPWPALAAAVAAGVALSAARTRVAELQGELTRAADDLVGSLGAPGRTRAPGDGTATTTATTTGT